MHRRSLATATLATALGLAFAGAVPARAQMDKSSMDPKAQTAQRMMQEKLEKCFGVAARGKNDCAQGAHSCAGQATMDRDPASFVLVPAGACGKLAGGNTKGA